MAEWFDWSMAFIKFYWRWKRYDCCLH